LAAGGARRARKRKRESEKLSRAGSARMVNKRLMPPHARQDFVNRSVLNRRIAKFYEAWAPAGGSVFLKVIFRVFFE
jgi:hypothetical protein